MKSYKQVREEMSSSAASSGCGKCVVCSEETATVTLSSFGARCGSCYASYCRQGFTPKERGKVAEKWRKEIASMGKPVPL